MHRAALLLVALVAAAVVAAGAFASDTYIFGTAKSRVPGANKGTVAVTWAFKCLGDKLGEATYEYRLVAVRYDPKPVTRVTLLEKGTSKKGALTATLPPGAWQLQGDPFLCETERGAGSTSPEVGQTVQVPNYCAWTVTKAGGAAELEQGAAVKRVRKGSVVVPGAAVATHTAGVALATGGKDATATLGASSRLAVDARQCDSATGGWKLSLARGSVAVVAKPGAEARRPHVVATPNASSTAAAASWAVTTTGKGGSAATTVAVRSGTVTVSAAGKRVVVKAGLRTVVKGKAPPTSPTRS